MESRDRMKNGNCEALSSSLFKDYHQILGINSKSHIIIGSETAVKEARENPLLLFTHVMHSIFCSSSKCDLSSRRSGSLRSGPEPLNNSGAKWESQTKLKVYLGDGGRVICIRKIKYQSSQGAKLGRKDFGTTVHPLQKCLVVPRQKQKL